MFFIKKKNNTTATGFFWGEVAQSLKNFTYEIFLLEGILLALEEYCKVFTFLV